MHVRMYAFAHESTCDVHATRDEAPASGAASAHDKAHTSGATSTHNDTHASGAVRACRGPRPGGD